MSPLFTVLCLTADARAQEEAPVAPPPGEAPPAEAPPAAAPPADGAAPQAPGPAAPGPAGVQIFPGLLNPSISANGLFLAMGTWEDGTLAPPAFGEAEAGEAEGEAEGGLAGAGETFGTGLAVQEVEVQLAASVDPYFRANLIFALPGGEGIEVEEGYVTLVAIPRVSVNIGKFKQPFGRENLLHEHALLTVDRSLVGQRIFGEEGLNDMGVNAALLLPAPWYSELTVGVDRGANEVFYGSGLPEGLGGMAHWKNLVDLSSGTSLELGVSGATGLNAYDGRSVLGGVDVTLKSHGRGRRQWNRLLWQTEYLFLQNPGAAEDETLGGLYSTLEYALSRRWWVGGRFDYVGLPTAGQPTLAGTGILVFAPTEFSAVRLQYQHQALPDGHAIDTVVSQLNFTIGAHPAHAY